MGAGGGDDALRNPDFPVEVCIVENEENPSEQKRMAKMTDLEKWEIKQVSAHQRQIIQINPSSGFLTPIPNSLPFLIQMIAANVLPKEEYPEFDEETGILPNFDDEDGNRVAGYFFLPVHVTVS